METKKSLAEKDSINRNNIGHINRDCAGDIVLESSCYDPDKKRCWFNQQETLLININLHANADTDHNKS